MTKTTNDSDQDQTLTIGNTTYKRDQGGSWFRKSGEKWISVTAFAFPGPEDLNDFLSRWGNNS